MASIQGIYLALFGRPADPAGLAYWNEQSKNGADLSKIIEVMTKAPEAVARFSGLSDAALVTGIYQALFDRAPDAAGLAFFTEQLKSGKQTIGSLAINILDGAGGNDLILVQNREKAANAFTASLDTPAEIAAYSGTAAADFGRSFVKTVTTDPASIPTAEKIQASINTSLPGASSGQTPAGGNAPAAGGSTGSTDGSTTPTGPTVPTTPANTYKLNAAVIPKDGSGNLFVGSGNSADKFAITTNTATGIELGLSVRHRLGEVENGTAGSDNAVQFKNIDTADLAVAYSVYKNGGLDTANHTYKLFFDNNPSTATSTKDDGLTFILEAAKTASGYKWTLDADKDGVITADDKLGTNGAPDSVNGRFVSIIDDGKSPTGYALQNIQPLRAYIDGVKGTNANGITLDKKGTYDVTLSSSTKTGVLEASSTVQIVVNNDLTRDVKISAPGFDAKQLWVGNGNPNANFANVKIDVGLSDYINLGIGGRVSGVPTPKQGTIEHSTDGLVHFTAKAGATDERFAYSVSTEGKTKILNDFKFLMKIDTDPGLGKNFVVYELKDVPSKSGTNPNMQDSKASWVKVSGVTGFTGISDDGGDPNGTVTQNIENLSWFDATEKDGTLAKGRYDVVLEAYNKADGVTLLGMNHVVFDAL